MKTGNPALLRNAIMASNLAKACDGEKLATQETHPRGQIKSMIYDDNYGALSLARSPENRLMWAHYANEYCGAVIGLDTSVAGFSCLKTNFVLIYGEYHLRKYPCSRAPTIEAIKYYITWKNARASNRSF